MDYLQKHVAPITLSLIDWSVILVYTFINVSIHELSHIFIFYVQLNDAYLLSKNEKLFVHSIALFVKIIRISLIKFINYMYIQNESLTRAYIFYYCYGW